MVDPIDLFYLTFPIFYILGMLFLFFVIPFTIYFYKRKIPKAVKTLFWSAWKREPPLLLCHDSGRGEFTTIRERKGEGIVVTAQNKYKILPRWLPKPSFTKLLKTQAADQPQQDNPVEAPETDSPTSLTFLKDNFVLDYSDFVVKRTNLIGLDLPLFVGYTGKLCLLNPEALALYEAGNMMIKTEDTVLFNPHNIANKKIEDALQPLLLMDPRKIKQIISEGFDQSQIAGVVADTEEIARLGQALSPKMKLLIAIIMLALLAGLAVIFLPKLISGSPPMAILGLLGL